MSLLFRIAPNRFAECTLGGDALGSALASALGDAQIREKSKNQKKVCLDGQTVLVAETRRVGVIRPYLCPYSPECVEGLSSQVR